jgi:Big-like domain-containing protein/cadherin-like protein
VTDQPTTSVRRRAVGIAASTLMLANLLITPATVMAAGGPGTPPTLNPDTITIAEDSVTPATGNVLDNDVNSSGITPFIVSSYTGPAASVGTLVINPDGSYTFTPAPNFSGSATASYFADNTKHTVGPATITINVTPTQDPPNANDDTITVVEDTATNVTAAILANDVDPDGDTISTTGVSNATGGIVSGTSTVTFTPTANLCGPGAGSFDYSVASTGGTDSAHVTVNITCVDDAPHAVNDSASGTEDTDVQILESTLVGNDTDVEGDTLSVAGVSNPSGGTVSRSGGTVTFSPSANLCGNNAASFDYTVDDGNGGQDTGHVTIDLTCVQDPPHAVNDTVSGTEDTDVVISDLTDLTGNDTDPDGDTLTVTSADNASGGTVDLTSGTITFSPDANACGTGAGSFEYTIDDGNGHTDTGTVSVDLTCTNDNPDAVNDTVAATEGTQTDVTAAVLANDTDIDGDTLTVVDFDNVTGGTVDLTAGVLSFTPAAGPCGPGLGSFDYQVSDGNGGSDWATATVDVTCVNEAPTANDDTASGNEDQDVTFPASDLTANDTDPDNDALTVTDVSGATGGTVSLDSGTVTFTPDANACGLGEGSFDYTVDDGNGGTDTGSVSVDITCVNDSPSAFDDTASGTEDQDVTVDAATLAASSTDVEGDTLTVTDVSNPSGGTVELDGTTITFHPAADLCGTGAASFDYTVDDGNGGTDTGTVTIDLACVQDAPVAVDDTQSTNEDTNLVISDLTALTGNDTDADGDPLTVTDASGATGGTVSLDSGTITFTPTANLCGVGAGGFDYTVDDGNGGSDSGHVSVDITCIEDGPIAHDDTQSTNEDTNLVISDLTVLTGNDEDADNDTLTVTGVSDPTGGTVSLEGGTITFTPTANLCGVGAGGFDYTIDDNNGGSDFAVVSVDITCVNDNPTAVDDTATVNENSAAASHDVLGNDSDIDGDSPLTVTSALIDSAAHGTATTDGTTVTYTPANGFAGTAVISYSISDGHGGTDSAALTVTVNAVGGPDLTPPVPAMPGLALGSGRVDTSAPVRVSWTATDAGSGVKTYEVQIKIGKNAWKTIYLGPKAGSRVLMIPMRAAFYVRERATDNNGNRSSWRTTPVHRVVAAQNLNSSVTYTGGWTFVASRASSGGGYSFATKSGAAATYSFKALQVSYVAPKMSNGGFVKVYIDGVLKGRFSLKSSTVKLGQVIARWAVTPGVTHTIRIVKDGATGRAFHDAFVMLR